MESNWVSDIETDISNKWQRAQLLSTYNTWSAKQLRNNTKQSAVYAMHSGITIDKHHIHYSNLVDLQRQACKFEVTVYYK